MEPEHEDQQQSAERPVKRADDYTPPAPDDADQGEPGGDE